MPQICVDWAVGLVDSLVPSVDAIPEIRIMHAHCDTWAALSHFVEHLFNMHLYGGGGRSSMSLFILMLFLFSKQIKKYFSWIKEWSRFSAMLLCCICGVMLITTENCFGKKDKILVTGLKMDTILSLATFLK